MSMKVWTVSVNNCDRFVFSTRKHALAFLDSLDVSEGILGYVSYDTKITESKIKEIGSVSIELEEIFEDEVEEEGESDE